MPDEVGPPNGASIRKFRSGIFDQHIGAGRKSCTYLAKSPRARLRRDPIEDHAGKITFVLAPCGASRRHQIGLRTQDGAVLHDFQAVGSERCAASS